MQSLKQLQEDIKVLKTKETSELYTILIQTGEEITKTIQQVIDFRKTMTFHKGLDALLEEVEEYVNDLHEIYTNVIESSSVTIRLKHLFEVLDEAMGGIDDFIESVNELFEEQGFNIDYIESWDIGFFIDNM
ncbi:hypothetical protein [Cellulosilyticum ruminicola]|uniref:hypothetical protein n=1 Tax=Cellulosilyticum ruminicola TaxID=425254 RepID=UPI0006D25D17|nr:hypothetical protein [Cellulosilyticum ruminicola]